MVLDLTAFRRNPDAVGKFVLAGLFGRDPWKGEDAIHIASRIVKHLWIIFVLLPFVAALSWAIVIAVQSSGTTPR